MNSSPTNPCPQCSAKYPHHCGIKIIPMIICTLCKSPAYAAPDGYFRHANKPWEDASSFCEKYGYPISVETVPSPTLTVLEENSHCHTYLVHSKRETCRCEFGVLVNDCPTHGYLVPWHTLTYTSLRVLSFARAYFPSHSTLPWTVALPRTLVRGRATPTVGKAGKVTWYEPRKVPSHEVREWNGFFS